MPRLPAPARFGEPLPMALPDAIDAAEPIDIAVAVAYAVVIGAVVGERVWLLLRTGSARLDALLTAAGMGMGALLAGVVVTAVERALWPVLAGLAPGRLVALIDVHLAVEVAVAFVAWDAAGYAHHWLGHRSAVGWASHQVHHTGTDYDLSLAWRQSWFPVTALATFPLVALTGARFEVAIVCAVASNTWQALVHTSAPVRTPAWLAATVMTPRTHLLHHRAPAPVNLGPVLTIWDRLAGTWDPGPLEPVQRQPPVGRRQGALAIELAGWRELVTSSSSRR